jgi:hypothetical protein
VCTTHFQLTLCRLKCGVSFYDRLWARTRFGAAPRSNLKKIYSFTKKNSALMTQPRGDYFRFKNTLMRNFGFLRSRAQIVSRRAAAFIYKNVRARSRVQKARKEQLCARTPKSRDREHRAAAFSEFRTSAKSRRLFYLQNIGNLIGRACLRRKEKSRRSAYRTQKPLLFYMGESII